MMASCASTSAFSRAFSSACLMRSEPLGLLSRGDALGLLGLGDFGEALLLYSRRVGPLGDGEICAYPSAGDVREVGVERRVRPERAELVAPGSPDRVEARRP